MKLVHKIAKYEDGNMTQREEVAFFQYLIDCDIVDAFRDHYKQVAKWLIEEGLCEEAN
jgi:hypothetical protein